MTGWGLLAVILAGGEAILLVAVVVLVFWVLRMRRLLRTTGAREVTEALQRSGDSLASVQRQLTEIGGQVQDTQRRLEKCLQSIGIVRYDAFRDMGGQMSFSLAILDGQGDGVVLSVLNGREDSRVYAKPVKGRRSPHPLSKEEQEALKQVDTRGR